MMMMPAAHAGESYMGPEMQHEGDDAFRIRGAGTGY